MRLPILPSKKDWMMKVYILAFAYGSPSRQEMLDFLDTLPEIKNWRASEGVIYLAAEISDDQIAEKIRAKYPKLRFIVTQISSATSQGWGAGALWEFIAKPKAVSPDAKQ
jgi:hypothetical protein